MTKAAELAVAVHPDGLGAATIAHHLVRVLMGAATKPVRVVLIAQRSYPPGLLEELRAQGDVEVATAPMTFQIPRHSVTGDVDRGAIADALVKSVGVPWTVTDRSGRPLDWRRFDLVISIGVPWAHAAVKDLGVPHWEVSDWLWRHALGHMLPPGDRRRPDVVAALDTVREWEFSADQAYGLEYLTPPCYAKLYQAAHVPYTMLTGFIFPPDPPDARCGLARISSRIRPGRSVCVAVGRTGAYAAVIDQIAHQVSGDPFDVTFFHDRGSEFEILGAGRAIPIGSPEIASRSALLNSVAMGITRGGVTATEIAARCTLVLGEEKGHWLSKQQRAYAVRKGVGVPVTTAELMADPVGTVTRLLGDPAAAARAKGAAVPRDSLRPLAADIVRTLP